MRRVPKIGIYPTSAWERHRVLLAAVARIFRFEVGPVAKDDAETLAGLVMVGTEVLPDEYMPKSGAIRCLAFLEESAANQEGHSQSILFGDGEALFDGFRGKKLTDDGVPSMGTIRVHGNETVLATVGGHPIWTHRRESQVEIERTVVTLPIIESNQYLFPYFCGDRFIQILPLINFFRKIALKLGWHPRPNQACFVVDDPSLSSMTYGHLDFRQLLQHTKQHGYHVSIATIPLDGGRVNREVAQLFRENPTALSLSIHGNNHTYHELLTMQSELEQTTNLAHALRRIAEMERDYELVIDRVMEAPYATFSTAAIGPMAGLGFEGAMMTVDVLVSTNPDQTMPASLGLMGTEPLPNGLCGIPRMKMNSRWETQCILSALLGQPLVLAGHHEDFQNGMDVVERFVRTVNGLGPVEWTSLSSIARASYEWRIESNSAQMFAGNRCLEIRVPQGVDRMTIERSWVGSEGEKCRFFVGDHEVFAESPPRLSTIELSIPYSLLPRSGSGTIRMESENSDAISPEQIPNPYWQPWPVVRRLMMETRDRLRPSLRRGRQVGAEVHEPAEAGATKSESYVGNSIH